MAAANAPIAMKEVLTVSNLFSFDFYSRTVHEPFFSFSVYEAQFTVLARDARARTLAFVIIIDVLRLYLAQFWFPSRVTSLLMAYCEVCADLRGFLLFSFFVCL